VRWRQIVVLYVILGALAAAWVTLEPRRPALDAGTPPARPRFLAVARDQIVEVRIERAGRAVIFRRAGERWQVAEPSGSSVPPDLARAFVEALVDADEIDRVAAVPTDVEPFGLDDDATRVTITTGGSTGEGRGGGAEPTVVLLGRTNPTGTALYARRVGVAGVVLIGRNVRYYEDLIYEALPRPVVPIEAGNDAVGSRQPLTANRPPV
jgi:hypothetical protein